MKSITITFTFKNHDQSFECSSQRNFVDKLRDKGLKKLLKTFLAFSDVFLEFRQGNDV